jgi:hypothetical protein
MSRSPWEVAATASSASNGDRQVGMGGEPPASDTSSMAPWFASVLPIRPRPALRAEDLAPRPCVMANERRGGGKDADWRRVLTVGKASRSKRKASGEDDDAEARARPMTSSERGIKFRKKQQERQQRLLSSTEMLRREIARLEALKDLREGSALVTSFTEGGAPMKFAFEYFALFRAGVPLQGGGQRDDAFVLKQEIFLSEMLDPAMCFCGKPALPELIAQWRVKVAAHTSIRVERSSSHLVTTDNCATVVSEGFMHMRYARKTIEKMYPHAVANEELVQKLIGRMLHMPFRSKMYFNERGKLDRLEIEPDLFTALYGVLRDLRECELLLGKTRMPKLITNEATSIVTVLEPVENTLPMMAMMAVPASENDARATVSQSPRAAALGQPDAPMNLEFILS